MNPESNTTVNNSSSEECVVLTEVSPLAAVSSEEVNARKSIASKDQRKSEREAKKAEEEALKAEKKRLKEELKSKRAAELQLEKARKAEELQQEKARKAEERARKAEELQQEKARKLEELQQEKARKAEELQQEKARKAEERARREAENASKKAEQIQKKEQKQAAAQKQELVHKQMASYMGRYFKPIDKSLQKDAQSSSSNPGCVVPRCTDSFDQMVWQQDTNFVSDIIESIKSLKKIDIEKTFRPRLNSDSNSCQMMFAATTTTTTNPYLLKTRYIHFPEKYFNRPPYYGTLKKALNVIVNSLQPQASIDHLDYTIDSEGEWEEPCKDGEELRSDAEDSSDSEACDSDSDIDSFIVPHGHLSDDELNEDEQQQSTSTKQAREAAKSHVWDKKVARLHQQRELKPIFGCIHDPTLDEKNKFELSNYLRQYQKIFVPKEICQRPEQDEKEQEVNDGTGPKEEKTKRVSKKKSMSKKVVSTNDQQPVTPNVTISTPTVKRTGSVSSIVESASPSKRRKMNSNENCSAIDESDVIMADAESMNTSKANVLEDTSNVSEIKSSPLTVISNEDVKIDNTPICTLLIPKRKQPPV